MTSSIASLESKLRKLRPVSTAGELTRELKLTLGGQRPWRGEKPWLQPDTVAKDPKDRMTGLAAIERH